MDDYLEHEGFIRNKNSRVKSKLKEFCEKNVSRFDESAGTPMYSNNGPKYNYLDMVRDGSMAILRAVGGNMQKHYGVDVTSAYNTEMV